jgi:hypothetical protein
MVGRGFKRRQAYDVQVFYNGMTQKHSSICGGVRRMYTPRFYHALPRNSKTSTTPMYLFFQWRKLDAGPI